MITVPIKHMRLMLIKALRVENMWVGDNVFYNQLHDENGQYQFFMDLYYPEGRYVEDKLPQREIDRRERIREKITELFNKHSPIIRASGVNDYFGQPNFKWSLTNPRGDVIVDLKADSPHLMDYEWFFKGESRYAYIAIAGYIIVTLKELARRFDP